MISGGKSQGQICRAEGIRHQSLSDWIAADPRRSARVREARSQSADAYADKAEDALVAADEAAKVPQARELASHYRWMAKVRRPAEYGDTTKVDLTVADPTPEQVQERIARLMAKAQASHSG